MVLIFSHITSPRLQYICNFIFNELLSVDYNITIDSEEFRNFSGIRINYSDTVYEENIFTIRNHRLLFEQHIQQQNTLCFTTHDYKAFFEITDSDWPFDIFAASFYLLSRYEEYIPHEKDSYGRYGHKNSLAFKEDFLNIPLINIWVNDLFKHLSKSYPDITLSYRNDKRVMTKFTFIPTYDIDIAFNYKYKGFLRNIGGFIKTPSLERIKVLIGVKADPYDTYVYLDELHKRTRLKPVYFFLVAARNSQFDKNILPLRNAMWKLIKQHERKYDIGLHPSWQSGADFNKLIKEKEMLEAMADVGSGTITRSRQHYIHFNLPGGYRQLLEAGISDDYSMGYGSINGFRASVASSFFWYDLENDYQTSLRVHPFCFMEANAYYEQRLSSQEAYDELLHYLMTCKQVNGTLITIFHNNFFADTPDFTGWKETYEKFIARVQL